MSKPAMERSRNPRNPKKRIKSLAVWTSGLLYMWALSAQVVPAQAQVQQTQVQQTQVQQTQVQQTLRQLASARGLLLGGAVSAEVLDPENTDLSQGVAREYNLIVTENAMKWASLNNAPGQFNFTLAEFMLGYAQKNNQVIRGHTLVWHEQLPRYIAGITDKAELMAELKTHIQTVVTQFKGRVPMWDVVNEAVSDSAGNPLRETPFLKIIGPEYLELAFRWAHEADPAAKLYYNDYNTDGLNGKSDAVYALVKGLLEKGVPINGVGFQAHMDSSFSVSNSKMLENLERFKKLGLDVQLTEVDVTLKGDAPLAQRLEQQAKVYGDLLGACLAVKCSAFVMWGYTDLYSWRSSGYPLLFDKDYKPKPAYFALQKVLLSAPK